MGVLNVTPDSFTGDGLLNRPDEIPRMLDAMHAGGADMVDIGGESTRPGFLPVSAEEELHRVLPAIEAAVARGISVSIDTRKAVVAREALRAGAVMVNDVSGLADGEMATVAAEFGAWLVLMHNQRLNQDIDPMPPILEGLERLAARAVDAGVKPSRLIVDPGLGFGKNWRLNLQVVRDLHRLRSLGYPILVGPSRKGTISKVLGVPADDRLEGTLALVTLCIAGGASLVRVHDILPCVRAARITDALLGDAYASRGTSSDRVRD
jgi:dihydropteroate synthase